MTSPSGPRSHGFVCWKLSDLLERLEDGGGVAVDLHFGKHVPEDSFAVDDEGRSLDSHVLLAVHVLLFPDAVVKAGLVSYVGEQREGKLEFLGELGVRVGVVGADAEDDGALLLERG